jgi:hypothetical protein
MNKRNNRPFSYDEWWDFVEQAEMKRNIYYTPMDVADKTDKIYEMQQIIRRNRGVGVSLLRKYTTEPKKGKQVFLIRHTKHKTLVWPAIIADADTAKRVWIDKVGKAHLTGEQVPLRRFEVIGAHTWRGKWGDPTGTNYAQDVKWSLHGINDVTSMAVKSITSAKQLATMKPPAAQDYWNNIIPDLWWNLVWGGKTLYATPRDKIALLQLKHRNLWVAKHGGCDNTTCNAHGCIQEESQLHLWECQIIQRDFWRIIKQDMRHLGFVPEDEISYWILGVTKKDEHTGRPMRSLPNEEAGIVCIAWRALYAEIVKRRLEGGALNLKEARYKTWRMVLARVKAYGARWRKWYRRQQGHTHPKTFPQAHQQHALIELDDHANFEINDKLPALVKRCRE